MGCMDGWMVQLFFEYHRTLNRLRRANIGSVIMDEYTNHTLVDKVAESAQDM